MNYLALDIGGVCITIQQPLFLHGIGRDDLTDLPTELIPCIQAFEFGQIPPEEFARRGSAAVATGVSPKKFLQSWIDSLGEPMEGTYQVICEAVEAGITPVFFSDVSAMHMEIIRKHYPIARLVPDGVYSFQVGAHKTTPGARMFMEFERRFGKPYLYVDDRQACIDAARPFGWRTCQFHCAEDLRQALFPGK